MLLELIVWKHCFSRRHKRRAALPKDLCDLAVDHLEKIPLLVVPLQYG